MKLLGSLETPATKLPNRIKLVRNPCKCLLTAILLTLFSQTTRAHTCVLNRNTATEITVYNSCKNHLATGTSGHEDQKLREQVIALERENEFLERWLQMLK